MKRKEQEVGRRRFFVDSLDGQQVTLPGGEAHHAAHVLRLCVGAAVELFDGRGGTCAGEIVEINRGQVTVAVREPATCTARPGPVVHLAFAVPKGKRLDWLLEKTTELGAASLQPVIFERSLAGGLADESGGRFSQAKRQRWLGHCIAAAKQSGLNFLPEIGQPLELREFAAAGSEGERSAGVEIRLFGEAAERAAPLWQALQAAAPSRESQIHLLVGPEGGLTDGEREILKQGGFVGVRIGRTTLRVETATIALLAATLAACDAISPTS